MAMQFRITPAVKAQKKARISITGPSGSGKTYSALRLAKGLVGDEAKLVVIDTENGSASMYADEFRFDVLPLESFSPETYMEAIRFCEQEGYDCIIIDSLSHAWMGKDGALEQVDKAAARERGNSFGAWRHVTPMQTRMVDSILASTAHIIVTMRSKTEYIIDEQNGKKTPRKVGMAPVQRDGIEYEFDVNGEMDQDHNFVISKTRIRTLDKQVITCPGEELGQAIRDNLMNGVVPEPKPEPAQGKTVRLVTDDDAVDRAQYHPDGTPANAEAEQFDARDIPEPEAIDSLPTFKRAMLIIGVDDEEKMIVAKQAAGYGEDKLRDLDTAALQNIYGVAKAAKEAM